MSISAVSTSSDYYQNYWSKGSNSVGQQSKQDFQDLGLALQSGNLSGAQQAFSALQQLLPNAASSNSQNQNLPPLAGTSSIGTDLSALTQAIQSGNQTDAQTDLAKLTQDLQSVGGKGHHHHHHHASTGSQNSAAASSDSSAGSSSGNTQSTATAPNSSAQSGISQYTALLAIFQQQSAGSSLNVSA
jgi:hypothetical protein